MNTIETLQSIAAPARHQQAALERRDYWIFFVLWVVSAAALWSLADPLSSLKGVFGVVWVIVFTLIVTAVVSVGMTLLVSSIMNPICGRIPSDALEQLSKPVYADSETLPRLIVTFRQQKALYVRDIDDAIVRERAALMVRASCDEPYASAVLQRANTILAK